MNADADHRFEASSKRVRAGALEVALSSERVADDMAGQTRKLAAIRREAAAADPGALERLLAAAPDVEPPEWDRPPEA